MTGATARAHANIAFIKYWGNRDPELRLPLNDSLSMNLSAAVTTTTVRFHNEPGDDAVVLGGQVADDATRIRVTDQLARIRALADGLGRAEVETANTFPRGTGLASSASGFAALTVAACTAAGLDLDEAAWSRLARRGSGSAARSVPGGFVEWRAADSDAASYAVSIAPPEHWALCDVIAIVSHAPKEVGSSDGHAAAAFSPLLTGRLADVDERLPQTRRALLERDFATFGPLVEGEALSLHAVAMTGRPSLLYLSPASWEVLHAVRRWRREGLAAFFTLDAGPNVHVLCEGAHSGTVAGLLSTLPGVAQVLTNYPAGPAHVVPPPVA